MPTHEFPPHEARPSASAHKQKVALKRHARKHIKAAIERGKKTKGKKIKKPRGGSGRLLPKVDF